MVEIERKLLVKIEERLSILINMYDETLRAHNITFVQKKAVQMDKKKIEKLILELNNLINN